MSRPALHKASAQPHGHHTKLLIIEDDTVHRMIIKKFAAELGFEIAEADNYELATTLIERHAFDCITLDLGLQSHTGLDVLRHLWNVGYKVPVLIISGADDAKSAETVGFAEFMSFKVLQVMKKPLDLKALKSALGTLKVFSELNGQVKT